MKMNEEEIKKKLSQEEYHVLREMGTEAPSGKRYCLNSVCLDLHSEEK